MADQAAPSNIPGSPESAMLQKRIAELEYRLAEEQRQRQVLEESLTYQNQLRVSAEEQLLNSLEMLRMIIEYAPAYIFIKDLQSRYLIANQRIADLFGLRADELLGRTEHGYFPEEHVTRWQLDDQRVIKQFQSIQYEEDAEIGDGIRRFLTTKFPVFTAAGELIGVGGIITDMTELYHERLERQRLEARMREAQRLESLGALAGGIAHDFNNILTTVLGHADLALLEVRAESPAGMHIVEVVAGVRRAAELTSQMLAYAGKGSFVRSIVRLSDLVREMVGFMRVSVAKQIELIYTHGRNEPLIEADVTQLRQVLLNLLLNGAEAIGDRKGQIIIRTGLAMHADPRLAAAQIQPSVVVDRFAYLEVRDNGTGMSDEVLQRIFDPFFTTKFVGRGLGMSVVLGIVRGHSGAIMIESTPGEQTNVTIFFPAATQRKPVEQPAEVRATEARPRTVLIVDDELSVLTIARRMVEHLGHAVLIAQTPAEALAYFDSDDPVPECVILDLTMPEMDGLELLQLLRDRKANLRVILTSGYSEQYATEQFANLDLAGFLPKPYRIDALRTAMQVAFPDG